MREKRARHRLRKASNRDWQRRTVRGKKDHGGRAGKNGNDSGPGTHARNGKRDTAGSSEASNRQERQGQEGQVVVVIATGPSLTARDCDLVKKARILTIAVNDAYRLAPWANHLYACDAAWWNVHRGEVDKTFKGRKWSQNEQPRIKFDTAKGITLVTSTPDAGLRKNALCRGNNSGYQAINLAYMLGATKVILLGFDMTGKGSHFFGKHPPGLTSNTDYNTFVSYFGKMHPERYGLEVVNASRHTALTCFRHVSIDQALRELK